VKGTNVATMVGDGAVRPTKVQRKKPQRRCLNTEIIFAFLVNAIYNSSVMSEQSHFAASPGLVVQPSTVACSGMTPESAASERIFIYTLSDPRTGEVRYVGKTAYGLQHRLRQHVNDRSVSHKTNWIRSLKAAEVRPIIEVLEEIVTSDEGVWQEAEAFWIESLRQMGCRLTNLRSGGYGGGKLSRESREKVSASLRAATTPERRANSRMHMLKNWDKISAARRAAGWRCPEHVKAKMRGSRISEETKAKLRAINLGKRQTKETIAKRMAKMKGRPLSLEHRMKISRAISGKHAIGVYKSKESPIQLLLL
jgi:hypothetical protein